MKKNTKRPTRAGGLKPLVSPSSPSSPSIVAKCIIGHKETLTAEQVKEAQQFGCAMCSQCGNPMTVQRVSA